MVGKARGLLAAAALAVSAGAAAAQAQILPPAPVPVSPPPAAPARPAALQPPRQAPAPDFPPPPPPSAWRPTPPPTPVQYVPAAPPGLVDNYPRLPPHGEHANSTDFLMPPSQRPGFFGAIEVSVLAPHIGGRLAGGASVLGVPQLVSLPNADLDWTGSPKLEIGYRIPDGGGELIVGYRSVVSEGAGTLFGFDRSGAAFLESRLNANLIDLDYHTGPLVLAPCWDVSFRAGAKVAAVYYDTRATGPVVGQRVSSNFVGAGPHAGLEVSRDLDLVPGLAAFGRLDGAVVFGEVSQSFEETMLVNRRTLVGGASNHSEGQAVPVLTFLAGLSYTPQSTGRWIRFSGGYQFEQWWGIGDAGSSTGDLRMQGLFFRGEFNF